MRRNILLDLCTEARGTDGILNFSPPFSLFLSFGKTVRLEKTQISTKRLKPAAEGRNPDSYECLSGYVSGVCIEPMATGIKYQSKNPIKLQEFLANRLLSSPSPSLPRSFSRSRLHSLHRLSNTLALARAQSLLPSQFYYFCVYFFPKVIPRQK